MTGSTKSSETSRLTVRSLSSSRRRGAAAELLWSQQWPVRWLLACWHSKGSRAMSKPELWVWEHVIPVGSSGLFRQSGYVSLEDVQKRKQQTTCIIVILLYLVELDQLVTMSVCLNWFELVYCDRLGHLKNGWHIIDDSVCVIISVQTGWCTGLGSHWIVFVNAVVNYIIFIALLCCNFCLFYCIFEILRLHPYVC